MDMNARRMENMERKMDENARRMDANTQTVQNMESRMDPNTQALKGDMQTQRGEMQSMGLSLQASMKGIMAAPRGGPTEPTRSVQCVWPVMETGKVGTTSDVLIDGETETCRVRHEGTTEKTKEVTEIL